RIGRFENQNNVSMSSLKTIFRRCRTVVFVASGLVVTIACAPSHADVTIGAYIHQSRRYIVFVGDSSGPFDMQCKFTVFTEYVDASSKSIGMREISISTIIKARSVKFQEEAGREHIAILETQFSSPTIL